MSQFRTTRNLYLEYLSSFEFPLTYESWLAADDEYKAVLLFVNFFDEIELAWYKQRWSYVLEEEAVSTVNLYLIKNVEKIKADPKRFRPGYIYTVASNCIYCLREPLVEINRDKYEVSNEISVGDDIVNLYDLAPSVDDSYEVKQAKEAVWDIIAKMGPKAEKVVNRLINPDDSLAVTRGKSNANDKLKDVSVSAEEYDSIISSLRSNSELVRHLELIANGSDIPVGDKKREEFVKEIEKYESAIASAKTDKQKRDYRKALKQMLKDLSEYDRHHLALN